MKEIDRQMKRIEEMDVAITHGNYMADGSGDRVTNELARTFDVPLYYGFDESAKIPDDIKAHSLANNSLLSPLRRMKVVRDPYYFWNFRHVPECAAAGCENS